MVLIKYIVLGFCFLSVGHSVRGENCDQLGVLIYEDIACKPVKHDIKSCPSKYDCDFSTPKSGCNIKGKTYHVGEEIPSEVTYSSCNIGCRCEELNIICAILDCPEYLGAFHEPGCYPKYEVGKCCAVGQRCNVTENTKSCEVDGKSYKIGERFYPKDTCLTCVCHEDFKGKYDVKTCMRQNCASQLYHSSDINQNCAPAYFKFSSSGDILCCPDHWVCPSSSDKIRLINREVKPDPILECSYGDQKLKLGEGFERMVNKYGKDRKLRCECVVPPLLTCKEV